MRARGRKQERKSYIKEKKRRNESRARAKGGKSADTRARARDGYRSAICRLLFVNRRVYAYNTYRRETAGAISERSRAIVYFSRGTCTQQRRLCAYILYPLAAPRVDSTIGTEEFAFELYAHTHISCG